MAKYCRNCTILEEVSVNQYEEFQIILSLWVQFSEPVAKINFLSYLQLWNSLDYLRSIVSKFLL